LTRPVVVIDASAGAEILAKTPRGVRLSRLIPTGAARDVPEHFVAETAGVLRRWELTGRLTSDQAAGALGRLLRWRGDLYPLTPLLRDAWRYRNNLTIGDALYVALATRLGVPLLTDDHKLANAPGLPAGLGILKLPAPGGSP